MTVLITNDITTFREIGKNYRVVIFVNTSKHSHDIEAVNTLKNENAMRIRKATLRVFDGQFEFAYKDLYPPRFNNYSIVYRVTDYNTNVLGYLEGLLSSLAEANKSATITIKDWQKIQTRTARYARPSAFNALFDKYTATASLQENTDGTVSKIVKV